MRIHPPATPPRPPSKLVAALLGRLPDTGAVPKFLFDAGYSIAIGDAQSGGL